MRRPPVLLVYDLSSEIDPKCHTIISILPWEARTCLLIRQLLIHELTVPTLEMCHGKLLNYRSTEVGKT
ncbi:hypothetical protein AVEN_244731-1 [Araneus ventricosus]|uniref:Uncharacterized protein n=1 Tax=Araneus ventricosus TaxID=182803 RepID=A0A4Y2BTG9_ARAVE|nr:hypothetical protein AVEN_244731-1 [Araneus ventricosus]